MTDEELEAVRRACFELWGLDKPDVIEAYHAYRILQIKEQSPREPLFEDFRVRWMKYVEKEQV